MPNIGNLLFISCFIIGIAYLPVAAGSPGPFDKNIPSGFSSKIFWPEVLAGTIFTLQFKSDRHLKIFFLIP